MSIPSGTSGVSSWGLNECSMSGDSHTASGGIMCEYGFMGVGHGKARYWVFIFIHIVQEFWKVWFLYPGKLVNLGWIVQYVLAETLIQMMHLRRVHTVFLVIWNMLRFEGLGG